MRDLTHWFALKVSYVTKISKTITWSFYSLLPLVSPFHHHAVTCLPEEIVDVYGMTSMGWSHLQQKEYFPTFSTLSGSSFSKGYKENYALAVIEGENS